MKAVSLVLFLSAMVLLADEPVRPGVLEEAHRAQVQYRIVRHGIEAHPQAVGLGFFVSHDGIALLPAYHLSQGLPKHLLNARGEKVGIREVLAVDEQKALAAVMTDHKPEKWLSLSPKEPKVGTTLWFLPRTKLQRILSGPLLSVQEQLDPTGTAGLQVFSMGFRPPTTYGPTGLPLFDLDGRVCAVFGMTGSRGHQLLSFALPVSDMALRIEAARKRGLKPDPGVALPEVDDPAASSLTKVKMDRLQFQGRLGKAAEAAEALVKEFPKSPTAWLDRGNIASMRRDKTLYRECVENVLKLAPNHRLAASNLARLHVEAGELERAEEVLKGLTRDAPKFAVGWWQLGKCQAAAGDFEGAAGSLKRSLELAPEIIQGWDDYAQVLSRLRRSKEAQAATDKAYELDDLFRLR